MSDDLRWSWCHNNKVHSKCNVLASSHIIPLPPQSVEKLTSMKLVPDDKKVGTPVNCEIWLTKKFVQENPNELFSQPISPDEKEQGGSFKNEACTWVQWFLGRVRGSRNHFWIVCDHGEVDVAELGWGHLLWATSSPQRRGSLWYSAATVWPLWKYSLMLTLQLALLCLLSQSG